MGFYESLTSLDGKRGCFCIILVATILTIFEIAFFYLVVVPNINFQFNNGISTISKSIANKVNLLKLKYIKDHKLYSYVLGLVNSKIDTVPLKSYLHTLNEREKIIINKNNRYVAFTGLAIITVLILLLIKIKNNIYKNTEYIKKNEDERKGVLTSPIWTAVFTVIILISFQIRFYFFSQEYKFLGTGIDNEHLVGEINEFAYSNI